MKTAYAILDSWKKNYNKGKKKQNCPVVKRPFVRVKQTLMKLEGDKLRITVKPYEYLYIDLSKRYFKLSSRIGEPILTMTHIHLPVESCNDNNGNKDNKFKRGWVSNKLSMVILLKPDGSLLVLKNCIQLISVMIIKEEK